MVLVLSETWLEKAEFEMNSTRWGGVAVESTRPAVQWKTNIYLRGVVGVVPNSGV